MVQYRVGRTVIEFTSKSFLFYYSKDIYRLEPTFSLLSYLSRLIINMGRIISASRERLDNFSGKNMSEKHTSLNVSLCSLVSSREARRVFLSS